MKTSTAPQHFLDYSKGELLAIFKERGWPAYRLRQVLDWTLRKKAESFDVMSSLPQTFRQELSEQFILRKLTLQQRECSKKDATQRLTFSLLPRTKSSISAVCLPHERYQTLCISSQVGCAWQCGFCASGLVESERNMSAGEILDQVLIAENILQQKIANILFMGMGEPLSNLKNITIVLKWLTDKEGLAMSAKRITVSTTGIPQAIAALSELRINANIAFSLHAADDLLRKKIMPVSARYPVFQTLQALAQYQKQNPKAEVTLEYILLGGTNDTLAHADQLIRLVRKGPLQPWPKINLIPYNPVDQLPFLKPQFSHQQAFFDRIKSAGILVHTRKPQGQDIGAACGQLSQ